MSRPVMTVEARAERLREIHADTVCKRCGSVGNWEIRIVCRKAKMRCEWCHSALYDPSRHDCWGPGKAGER